MKEFILNVARECNLAAEHVLPNKVLIKKMIDLNPKQRKALEPAIKYLISEGFFEERDGWLFLTIIGENALY